MQSQSHIAIAQSRKGAAEQVQCLLLGHSPLFLPFSRAVALAMSRSLGTVLGMGSFVPTYFIKLN